MQKFNLPWTYYSCPRGSSIANSGSGCNNHVSSRHTSCTVDTNSYWSNEPSHRVSPPFGYLPVLEGVA